MLLLKELFIGQFTRALKISMEVSATNHGYDRTDRHESPIEKSDIVLMINKSSEKLIKYLLNGTIKLEQEIVIRDIRNKINIIGRMTTTPNRELEFVIITVMRKAGFKVKSSDFSILI